MWFRFLLLSVLIAQAGFVLADDAAVTVETIQSRLAEVEKSTTLNEESKATIRNLYQQATKDLASAVKAKERAEQFSQMARTAPEEIGRIRRELAVLAETPDSILWKDESLDRLRAQLTEREAELAQLKTELQLLKDEPKKRAAQRRSIPLQRVTYRKQLDDLQQELNAAPQPNEPPELILARQTSLRARANSLQGRLDAGIEELNAYEATIDLLPLQRDLVAARVARVQAEVEKLQQAVDRRLSSEVNEHLREAKAVVADVPKALKKLTEANLRLVQRRKELREQIEKSAQHLAEVNRVATDLTQQRARTEEKVDAVGLTGPVGLLLRQQKSRLPDVSSYRRDLRRREPELRTTQLAVLELEHRRADLADREVALTRAFEELRTNSSTVLSAETRERLRQVLSDELRYTDYLLDDSRTYVDLLLKLAGDEADLIEATEDFADYIDERVLWVRSAGLFSLQDVPLAADAARSLVDGEQWKRVVSIVSNDVSDRYFTYLLVLALLLLVLTGGRLMSARRTRPPALTVRQTRLQRILSDGIELLLYTLPLPLAFWLAGQRLMELSGDLPFLRGLGTGLTTLGRDLLPLLLLLGLCRPRGFVRRYLGWTDDGVRRIRAMLMIVILAVLPLTFVRATLDAQENVRWQDSLGRICFVVNVLLVAVLVERLLRPHRGVLYRTFASFQGDWLRRLRWVWYPIGVGTHLALAGMALVGYTYAADLLGNQVRGTALLALCLLLVGSFLVRWTRLNTRRLAIAHAGRIASDQRAAAAVAREFGMPPVTSDAGGGWLPEKADSMMQPLVSTVLIIIGLVGLWIIWSNVVPALNVVTQFTVWHTEVPIAETVASDQASQTLHRPTKRVPVTLGDVLLAGFILLATVFATRYIAGLFELPVLERLPLDNALENTITTVTRYALWIVAVIVAAAFLGIGWSKVQWMVAALSLGLGFGLQEIFANFISGLIILFERPMRVGDIITVGDSTGVVRAIRMRATTIMDWDRKELVVPNKEFATGRLLNWTLTNKTNRRVLRVGVEYGNDPDQVRDLLLKVARQSNRVMDDPAPIALFEEFGENALVFSLRVYHSKISHRLRGLHELNTAIQREFKAAGIRIAFPQRDLHLRGSQPFISWFGPDEEKETEQDESQS